MAVANFFDKAALAASQILTGVDYEAVATALDSGVVGVAFDDAAARSPEGRTTLELAVNLLARLYPRVAIVGTGDAAAALIPELVVAARAINPAIDVSADLRGASACIGVGASPVPTDAPTIYLGSDGWIARVSPDGPVGSGSSSNPFGAGAAACFGAANVFRAFFRAQLPHGAPDRAFQLSLIDLDPTAAHPSNPDLGEVDLGESHLVGLGAIGNGAVWALARTPSLRGQLHLVDPELVDLSNLQRYVLTRQADRGRPKVTLAAERFQDAGIVVHPHQQRWGEYLRARKSWRLDRVAVAVDSARDRVAIQAALPRWVVNAWTQPGDLGVSRHAFIGDQACLACLYLPEGERKHEDQLVAEAIGLPDAVREVRELLATNRPVGRDWIERIAAALSVPVEPLLPFEGRQLRAFYTEAVCGGTILALGGGRAVGGSTEVPMAFQSALAGLLLASELVAHASGVKQAPPPVTSKIDLLHPLGMYLSLPATKDRHGRCICQDPDYIAAYQAKYGDYEATSSLTAPP